MPGTEPGALTSEVLAQVFADAVTYREPTGACTNCGPGGLCPDHEADLDRAGAYMALAVELGITVVR